MATLTKQNIRLFKAVQEDDLKELEEAIKAGANVNAQDENGNTALTLAAMIPHPKIAIALLKRNADINIANKYGDSPLSLFMSWRKMMWNDDEKVSLKALLPDLTQNNLLSARKIWEKIKKITATLFINVNFVDYLHAIDHHQTKKLLKLFKEKPVNVDMQEFENGDTMLIAAVNAKSKLIVKYLVKNQKADPNIQNFNGETALFSAIRQNNIEMVEILLNAGAVNNVSNLKGETPITIALSMRNPKMIGLLIKYDKLLQESAMYSKFHMVSSREIGKCMSMKIATQRKTVRKKVNQHQK